MRLLVFSDYVCPYCRLAEAALRPVREQVGLVVDVAAFELRPPGTPLLEPDAAWMRQSWKTSVEPLAAELGVGLRYPDRVPRTRKAHEAVAWSRSLGAAEMLRLHVAIFDAYWRDGRDIGRIDVLVAIGEEQGLDGTALKVALDIDQWTEDVLRDERLAQRLRLSGAPAYVLQREAGTELRVGLQRENDLRDWLGHDI